MGTCILGNIVQNAQPLISIIDIINCIQWSKKHAFALMRADKIFDETWKIQRACLKNLCKTSMQHAKFSKTAKSFKNSKKHFIEFHKNI